MSEADLLRAAKIVSIVDDDEAFRLATGSLVRSFGRQTHLFGSAEEFLRSGCLNETACVISDVMMPGMSGVEMLIRMRALHYQIPTIFITSFPTADLTSRALAAGALVVLGKPVEPDAIGHWLRVALDEP
ncbi:response regulator [Pandoraea pnomenusa]|uniref:response regulator transcription factor n=1 Tax=Pandoraea pnomenusa TaxID=93220 RepID=UPI0033405942